MLEVQLRGGFLSEEIKYFVTPAGVKILALQVRLHTLAQPKNSSRGVASCSIKEMFW